MQVPLEHWGATPAEIADAMPGDDLIADAAMSATRAIDLACAPVEAFGWLTQMGFGKAGWYSYDLIDNLGRPSATHIHPEWQVQTAGEAVPGGPVDFRAEVVDAPDSFVLGLRGQRLAGHTIDFTLAYRLVPTGDEGADGTRLVTRARASIGGVLARIANPALCLGDGMMVRRQLLGLARRCAP